MLGATYAGEPVLRPVPIADETARWYVLVEYAIAAVRRIDITGPFTLVVARAYASAVNGRVWRGTVEFTADGGLRMQGTYEGENT